MPSVSESDEIDFGAIPEPVKRKFKSASPSERDLSFECALRNIRDLVVEDDRRWIDKQLHHPPPQELDKRITEWKSRNGKR